MVNVLIPTDYILILLYFVILVWIGYKTSRKQKTEDYLIGERKLNSWSTMATMNASKTGSILMTFVALTFLWGFSAIWYFIGVIAGVFLFIPFAIKLKEKSKTYYTLADYFKHNYGPSSGKISSLLSIFLMIGLAIINIIAGTKIFSFFTGWPFWICAIIMTLIIAVYLFLGGFDAVVKTDIIQYIAMILLLIIFTLILFKGTIIPSSEWNFFAADIGTIIGFFIVGILFPFASPDIWQRTYSAKDKKELKKGILLSIGTYAIFAILMAIVALIIKVKFSNIDPDLALIHGFANLLPAGLVGLAVILLFSAIMSSVDTYIYTASSAIIQDFVKTDKKELIKLIKKTILVVTLLGTLVAILIQNLVVSSYIFASFYAIIAIPTIATWVRTKINSSTLVWGFSVGIITTVSMLSLYLIKGQIEATLIIIALMSTIFGLFIGGAINYLRK